MQAPESHVPTQRPSWPARLARLLPSQCGVCRRWPSAPVCPDCLKRFAVPRARCPGCALAWVPRPGGPSRCPDCQREPLPLEGCMAGLDYGFPWSQLLSALKFQQQTGWTGFFAERLLAQDGVAALLCGLDREDWLLPLPLSTERLAERGYNQAWELAKSLHARSQCPARLDAGLLLKIRHTPPQTELGRPQRLDNVRAAFAVDPLRTSLLSGRRVVLVDDVMTSGASLAAAALALKAAGAAQVQGLVVARTPP